MLNLDSVKFVASQTESTPCFDSIREALFGADEALDGFQAPHPQGSRDFFLSLIKIYELHLGELTPLDGSARYAGHPALARVKWDLENEWITKLSRSLDEEALNADTFETISSLASGDLPEVYLKLTENPSGADTLLLSAYFSAVERAFLKLSSSCPAKGFPSLSALGFDVSDAVSELSYDLYPEPLLELEAYAGMLATNHWLTPEALGAITLHSLLSPARRAALFKAASTSQLLAPVPAPTLGVDSSSEVSSALGAVLSAHPEWSPRVASGAFWYKQLDDAFNAKLTETV